MRTWRFIIARNPGVFRVEDAAARKADDVVQEALRSMHAAVLIVDVRVYVAGVGAMDERRGCVVELRPPGFEDEVRHHFHPRLRNETLRQARGRLWGAQMRLQVTGHEEAGVAAKSACQKRVEERSRREHQQLGLYTLDPWSSLQHLQQVVQ
jgi:hypothetical protein